jgi:hypothetical protein
MSVFIGIEQTDGYMKIFTAKDYQKTAYLSFMSSNFSKLEFKTDGFIFNLKRFNGSGLQNDYSRFCILENDKKEEHIICDDDKLLRGFVGLRNRMIM